MRYETRLCSPICRALQWVSRRAPIVRTLLPRAPIVAIRDYLAERAIGALPDRRYLEDVMLPTLASAGFRRVLFAGCKRYTLHYGRYFERGSSEFWTLDCDPTAVAWGARDRQLTCDIRAITAHIPAGYFDVAMLNGVFGFRVNDETAMNETLAAIHSVLIPGGRVMIGWDKDLTPDPFSLSNMQRLFRRHAIEQLPATKSFPDDRHVYDFFAALPA